jgi:hypothetical protein
VSGGRKTALRTRRNAEKVPLKSGEQSIRALYLELCGAKRIKKVAFHHPARGTPHTYWNAGPEPLRYLLIMAPNIHTLIQEIHAMTERSMPALEAVFRKHDSEFLGF